MTAEPLSSEKAEAWGMIWKSVEDAELMRCPRHDRRICQGADTGQPLTKDNTNIMGQ